MDQEFGNRVLEQAMEFWILPELKKRKAAGEMPDSFRMIAAQVILSVDDVPSVRINGEVKGLATVKPKAPFVIGQPVLNTDIEGYENFELEESDLDAGHMTLIFDSKQTYIFFDFRYNRARIAATLTAAQDFLRSAELASNEGLLRPFCDALYSAVELMSRAQLLQTPDPKYIRAKTHKLIKSQINKQRKNRVAGGEFAGLLNELDRLRGSARYLDGAFELPSEKAKQLLEHAKNLLASCRTPLPQEASK